MGAEIDHCVVLPRSYFEMAGGRLVLESRNRSSGFRVDQDADSPDIFPQWLELDLFESLHVEPIGQGQSVEFGGDRFGSKGIQIARHGQVHVRAGAVCNCGASPQPDPGEQKFLQLPAQPCIIRAMEHEITGHELLWETIKQREEYPIFRLTYVSCAVEMLTDADLDDIESKSLIANDARDVTGLLIVNGRRILQILEGRESAVLELYEKIRKDPRHVIAKLVSTVEDEGRMLLTWNMVVRDVGSIPADALNQYNELYDELLHAKEPRIITIDDVDFLKSVALFSALPA